jgi:chromosome segregation ATPase
MEESYEKRIITKQKYAEKYERLKAEVTSVRTDRANIRLEIEAQYREKEQALKSMIDEQRVDYRKQQNELMEARKIIDSFQHQLIVNQHKRDNYAKTIDRLNLELAEAKKPFWRKIFKK